MNIDRDQKAATINKTTGCDGPVDRNRLCHLWPTPYL